MHANVVHPGQAAPTFQARAAIVYALGISCWALAAQPSAAQSGATAVVQSDDFSGRNLDAKVWRFIDPNGDAQMRIVGAGTRNARFQLSIPGGSEHSFTNRNLAPRIMQRVANRNFTLEVKFDSPLQERFQIQGVVVESDANNFQRFDFYSDGRAIKSYVGSYRNGKRTTRKNAVVPLSPPFYMRVQRSGSTWTQSYSRDGARWTVHTSYNDAMPVRQVGIFAANEHAKPASTPPFTMLVDYVFDRTTPVQPEEGGVAGTDSQGPRIHGISGTSADSALVVSWKSDEPTRGTVRYGTTQRLELGSVRSDRLSFSHAVRIPVQSGGTYYARIDAEDESGNRSTAPALTIAVSSTRATAGGPTIQLYHGRNQVFGHIGQPQSYINIVGNVRDPDGVRSLSYSLNGSAHQALSIGPNRTRLAGRGDFNADIATSRLVQGTNLVEMRAVDTRGNTSQSVVQVRFDHRKSWPESYTANWANAVDVNDIAQVVDGRWTIQDNRTLGPVLRSLDLGYDRLVAIGQGARNLVGGTPRWVNYEITVPITIHALDSRPAAYTSPSNGPAVGFVLRWSGHTVRNRIQPADGFRPLGAFISYRVRENGQRLVIVGNDGRQAGVNRTLNLNVTYMFKARVRNVRGGARYSFKVWPRNQAEPSAWTVELQQGAGSPTSGSVLLVAHHVDASFGNARIVRLL